MRHLRGASPRSRSTERSSVRRSLAVLATLLVAGLAVSTCKLDRLINPDPPGARSPDSPASLAQFRADSLSPIVVGAGISDPVIVVRAVVGDPDPDDSLRLQVELQPLGTDFTGQPTATSAPVLGGGQATTRADGLMDNTSYHWRARSIDQTGRASAWVAFGGNGEDVPDVVVAVPDPPADPTSLSQFRSDGITAIARGGTTDERTVVIRGTVADPDPGDQVRLEIEMQPVGTLFTGTATAGGVQVPNGAVASVTVTGLTDGVSYHWQARAVDQLVQSSGWVPFGAAGQGTAELSVALPPADLVFTTQPGNVTAGSVITPAVKVEARKASGIVDTTYGGTVDIVIAPGTGTAGAKLSGTTSVTAARGVASFNSLSIDLAGAGYQLLAYATALTSATSSSFAVTAKPSRLGFAQAPDTAAASGMPLARQPVLQLQDANGKPVPQAGVSVAATVASGPVGATLSGAAVSTDASGRATFTALGITGLVGSYTLRFGATGLTPAVSGAIALHPGVADAAHSTASVPQGVLGSPTSIGVTVRDGAGNRLVVGGDTVRVTVTGANTAAPPVTDNGNGTYATAYTPMIVGTDKVAVTLNGNPISDSPYTSQVIAVGVRLVFLVAPSAVVAGVNISPPLRVAVQDVNGNTVASSTAAITIAIGANPSGGKLSGTKTVNAVSGVATFSDLRIDRAGTGYTLTARANGLTSATSPPFTVTNPGG